MESCLRIEGLDPKINFSWICPSKWKDKEDNEDEIKKKKNIFKPVFSDELILEGANMMDGLSVRVNFQETESDKGKLLGVISNHFPESHFFPSQGNMLRQLQVNLKKDGKKFKCNLKYLEGRLHVQVSRTGRRDDMVLHEALKKLKRKIRSHESRLNDFEPISINHFQFVS